MSFTAFLLIVISAGLHASWNMVARKNRMTVPFYTVIGTTAMLIWLHVQFWTPVPVWSLPGRFWLMTYASVTCDCIYCFGLMQIYKRMEMATAYPVMRSLPIILTALATYVLGWGKPLTAVSCLGFLIVFAGALLMPLSSFSDFKLSNYLNLNMLFILVAACGTTGYTIFDSQSQQVLKACLPDISAPIRSLTYYSTRGMALTSTLWILCLLFKGNRQDVLAFRDRKLLRQAILAGLFASFSYTLVLCAMNYVTNVSYVQVFRQLGLPIGMLLGVFILKEHCTLNKVVGMVMILAGLAISVLG
jgi:drug/metabolite transporter (DMT)-like permease